jgi:molybdopterin biosynthesis protein moeB
MNPTAKEQYKKQILLDWIDENGQEILAKSKVLVVGAGGLGSPALLYLVASGIGEICIADFDVVSLSNLPRQVLYSKDDIGKYKVDVAQKILGKMNPDVKISTIKNKISGNNLAKIIQNYDIILDCTDNFETREILGSETQKARKILVSGAVLRHEGLVFIFNRPNDICRGCVFPTCPKESGNLNTNTLGVLNTLCGVTSMLMVTKTLNILLGMSFVENMITIDLSTPSIRTLTVKRRTHCNLCG